MAFCVICSKANEEKLHTQQRTCRKSQGDARKREASKSLIYQKRKKKKGAERLYAYPIPKAFTTYNSLFISVLRSALAFSILPFFEKDFISYLGLSRPSLSRRTAFGYRSRKRWLIKQDVGEELIKKKVIGNAKAEIKNIAQTL